MSIESKLVLVAEEMAERVVTKEAIRQAIIAKGTSVPTGTALHDFPTKISEITTSGILPAIVEAVFDDINGEVIPGNYIAKSDSTSTSKENIRLAIIAKGVAVPVGTPLSDYDIKIGEISSGGGEVPIMFSDTAVKTICATNWGSGGEITPTQAAAVTSIQFGETFRGNTTIISFAELQYFTGLTTIPANAFRSCTNLAGALRIPANITTIGAYAFFQCKFTGTLIIPSAVTSIGTYSLRECTGFTGNLVIPNTVTTIGDRAFLNSTGMTGTLTIGTGITIIPAYCFYGCMFTGALTIPANITTIHGMAFSGCTGFTGNLVIPNTVTSLTNIGALGDQFSGCTGMRGTLTIGTGIWLIPNNCFNGCLFTGPLTIPANITNIESFAFSGCSGFTGNLVIPNTVVTIGASAFSSLTKMTGTLTIGTGITTIPQNCFSSCKFTGTPVIPANVTNIEQSAFWSLTTLTSTKDERTTPPTLGTSVFSGTFPIYVPTANVAAYKAATNWSTYTARIFGY